MADNSSGSHDRPTEKIIRPNSGCVSIPQPAVLGKCDENSNPMNSAVDSNTLGKKQATKGLIVMASPVRTPVSSIGQLRSPRRRPVAGARMFAQFSTHPQIKGDSAFAPMQDPKIDSETDHLNGADTNSDTNNVRHFDL